MIVKPGLRPPTDMQGRINVGFAPFHNFAEFFPILDLLKGQQLYRRAGDNHAVKPLVPNLTEGFIEFEQVLGWGIL